MNLLKTLVSVLAFVGSLGAVCASVLNFDSKKLDVKPAKKEVKGLVSTNYPKNSCTIYKVKRAGVSYKVTEITEKIKNNYEFINGLVASQEAFVNDINRVCNDEARNVYIFDRSGKWIYSTDLNRTDWVKKGGIIKSKLEF